MKNATAAPKQAAALPLGDLASGYNVIATLANDYGINPTQGAGIAGSFGTETGGYQHGSQLGGGPGRGYAQWELPQSGGSGRGDAFVNYMRSHDQPSGALNFLDPASNIGYFAQEFYGGTPGYGEYGVWGADTLRTDSAAAAARTFTEDYLRPGTPHMADRVSRANAYDAYYQSQQDPGYLSGNYYGDYGLQPDIFRLPAAQSWSGDPAANYGYGGEAAPPAGGGLYTGAVPSQTAWNSGPDFTVGGPPMGSIYGTGGGGWFGGANDGSSGNMGSAGGIPGGGTAGIMPEGLPTSYSWGQGYMGGLAAQNDATLAALPSSPQNFSQSFQPQVNQNIAALNPTGLFDTYAANTSPYFDFSYAAPPVFV